MTDRQGVSSGSPFEPTIGFSRAMRVGDRVIVSGTGPVLPGGGCPEGAGAQARRCFEIIRDALAEAGAGLDDVVRTRMYITASDDAAAVGAVHGELLGVCDPPPRWWWWPDCWTPPGRWRSRPRRCFLIGVETGHGTLGNVEACSRRTPWWWGQVPTAWPLR